MILLNELYPQQGFLIVLIGAELRYDRAWRRCFVSVSLGVGPETEYSFAIQWPWDGSVYPMFSLINAGEGVQAEVRLVTHGTPALVKHL